MAFLASSSMFISCVLIGIISFITKYMFRSKVEHVSPKNGKKTLVMAELKRKETLFAAKDSNIMNSDASEQRDVSGLSFKFPSLDFEELSRSILQEKNATTGLFKNEMKINKKFVTTPSSPTVHPRKSTVPAKYSHLDITHSPYFVKEVSLFDINILDQKKDFNSDTDSGARIFSEFSSFNSDTESLGASDGYSVKDLILDSDDFLSEMDFHLHEHELSSSQEPIVSSSYTALRKYKLSSEGQSHFFNVSVASDTAGHVGFKSDYPCLDKQPSSSNISMAEHLSESGYHKSPTEQEQLDQEVVSAISAEVSSIQDRTVSSNDELYLIKKYRSSKNNSGESISKDLVDQEILNGDDDIMESENVAELLSSYRDMQNDNHCIKESRNLTEPYSNNQVIHDGNHAVKERGDVIELSDLHENRSTDFIERKFEDSPNISEKVHDNLQKKYIHECIAERKHDVEEKISDSDDDDFDALESLWEHQDLIEQLKMEIRKVRAIGLPTILEESETSFESADNLKPWKIDGKFLHEDPMDELHTLFKSYRERMRKFDILSYQKMYAIGFLQLKDPLRSVANSKTRIPSFSSILIQNCSLRKTNISSTEQFIKELRNDFEVVYVGQTCLSWEFLCWQYEKAVGLPEFDPYRTHCYNQVAGEFQQFQVVLQRFMEDEACLGSRLENYVKSRCVLRNLNQVPVIQKDTFKHKTEDQPKDSFLITSKMLEDIIEESINVFWKFVKADKDETPTYLKGIIRPNIDLQDPLDLELMLQIQSGLHKK